MIQTVFCNYWGISWYNCWGIKTIGSDWFNNPISWYIHFNTLTATSPDLGNPDGRWTKKNQQEKPGTGIALKMAVRRSTIRFWVTSFVSCLSMFISGILWYWYVYKVFLFSHSAWKPNFVTAEFGPSCGPCSLNCCHPFQKVAAIFTGLKPVQNWENERTGENHCSLHHSWHVPTIILQSSCMRLVPSIFVDGRSTPHIGLVGNDPSALGCALQLAVSN